MTEFTKVASTDDLAPGDGSVVEVNGVEIALYNVDGAFYALSNTCVHQGGPLGEGFIEGETVTCPWHGWQYNVKTGVSVMSDQIRVACYEVKVEGSDVLAAVP
jgi:nitrite reductase/ring-hydroxylating ferredoxin subunit